MQSPDCRRALATPVGIARRVRRAWILGAVPVSGFQVLGLLIAPVAVFGYLTIASSACSMRAGTAIGIVVALALSLP